MKKFLLTAFASLAGCGGVPASTQTPDRLPPAPILQVATDVSQACAFTDGKTAYQRGRDAAQRFDISDEFAAVRDSMWKPTGPIFGEKGPCANAVNLPIDVQVACVIKKVDDVLKNSPSFKKCIDLEMHESFKTPEEATRFGFDETAMHTTYGYEAPITLKTFCFQNTRALIVSIITGKPRNDEETIDFLTHEFSPQCREKMTGGPEFIRGFHDQFCGVEKSSTTSLPEDVTVKVENLRNAITSKFDVEVQTDIADKVILAQALQQLESELKKYTSHQSNGNNAFLKNLGIRKLFISQDSDDLSTGTKDMFFINIEKGWLHFHAELFKVFKEHDTILNGSAGKTIDTYWKLNFPSQNPTQNQAQLAGQIFGGGMEQLFEKIAKGDKTLAQGVSLLTGQSIDPANKMFTGPAKTLDYRNMQYYGPQEIFYRNWLGPDYDKSDYNSLTAGVHSTKKGKRFGTIVCD